MVRRLLLSLTPLALAACGGPSAEGVSEAAAQSSVREPSRFLTRLFVDGLGRAPDVGGWQHYSGHIQDNGCHHDSLASVARGILKSQEFQRRGHAKGDLVRIFYRALLWREPGQRAFINQTQRLRDGLPWTKLLDSILNSREFKNRVGLYCGNGHGRPHRQDWAGYFYGFTPEAYPPASQRPYWVGTQRQLRHKLAELATKPEGQRTLTLGPALVIPITEKLVVPEGVTIETYRNPGPRKYPRMARLLRGESFDGDHIVELRSGAQIRSVWVDGQFGHVTIDGKRQAALVARGHDIRIDRIRIEGGEGNQMYLSGPRDGVNCDRTSVTFSLLSGFWNDFSVGGENRFRYIADGITNGCNDAHIHANHIVDATDVAIVFFPPAGATQKSVAEDNNIFFGGVSGHAALVVDQVTRAGRPSFDYTGARLNHNQIWTSDNATVDIVLSAGAYPWFPEERHDFRRATGRFEMLDNSSGGGKLNANTAAIAAGVDHPAINISGFDLNPMTSTVRCKSEKSRIVTSPDVANTSELEAVSLRDNPNDYTNCLVPHDER